MLTNDRPLPLEPTAELRSALDDAHTPTLLMVYVHLTGDTAMLDHFEPYITSPWAPDPTPMPAGLEDELREQLFQVLTRTPGVTPKALDAETMQRMMSVAVGEPIPTDQVPLLLEQMGFELPPSRATVPGRKTPPSDFNVLIIGAGLTGIVASIKLAEAGYDHVIIEKNPEIGGTWYENRYPGCGVDTPSHFYSYSFEINPEWTTYYPKAQEMQDYLLRVADKYSIRDRTRFNTRVLACLWDEASKRWQVTLQKADGSEEVVTAKAVINAHGPLNRWKLPPIPGLDTYKGIAVHTAGWTSDIDVTGKKVILIGTGASAVQLAPAIADKVQSLTVLQRDKHWLLHNPEIAVPVTEGVQFAMRHIPKYKEWFRFRVYWFAGDGLFVNVLKDPDWADHPTSVSAVNDMMRNIAVGYLQAKTEGRPDLYEKLLPDFPIFSKRLLLDTGWFDTLRHPNVRLENTEVTRITETGVVTSDGEEIEADIIIFATGFITAKALGPLTVVGREGASLGEIWGDEDPRSYLGVTVPQFPNFFLTVGPNSAPNHAAGQNLLSEAQTHYIIECLDRVVAEDGHGIEPTRDAFDAWNRQIETRMQDMIWSHPKAKSYYNNSKGRNFMSWPYRLVDYWNASRTPEAESFQVLK
ncbi:MAG: NAD(P)/FAD-dependent oxidoreductase [Candidatus Brevundimonas phytovorans]|nr:NAD(P)/FAD-dependent oxidoreductase [Brevundimonas sp.]WEK56779.1 MAG: NAD(P)/FAD-dependent oxidoreductase [Brevundimonas sp.]